MKRILFVLILCMLVGGAELLAQTIEVVVKPRISVSTLTFLRKRIGSKYVSSTAKVLTPVTAGDLVFGPGIPYGTTVASKVNADSLIILSNASTTSDSTALDFGYFTSAATTSGRYCSMPFEISLGSGPYRVLGGTLVADTSVQNAGFRIALATSGEYAVWPNLHNVAASYWDPTYYLGEVTTGQDATYGTVSVAAGKYTIDNGFNIWLPTTTKIYGRLIANSTSTYLSTQSVTVKFRFFK